MSVCRSAVPGAKPLHLVSALETQFGIVLGQEATAEKSNEITAIPLLLESLMIQGAIVTIDAIGTYPHIAGCIRDRQAHYVLAVKGNQPKLAEAIQEFFHTGEAAAWKDCPHDFLETLEKGHGRIEHRRYYAFNHLACLPDPHRWPGLGMFGVVVCERDINGKISREQRLYIGSIAADAKRFAHAVRSHWAIENRLHWCLDVCLNDDQARARVKNAARNLATVRRIGLNLFRLDHSRKGGIKARRMLASSSNEYRAQLLGGACV